MKKIIQMTCGRITMILLKISSNIMNMNKNTNLNNFMKYYINCINLHKQMFTLLFFSSIHFHCLNSVFSNVNSLYVMYFINFCIMMKYVLFIFRCFISKSGCLADTMLWNGDIQNLKNCISGYTLKLSKFRRGGFILFFHTLIKTIGDSSSNFV